MKTPRKYAEGSRIYGWLRASEFAKAHGCSGLTVRRWIVQALAGRRSKLARADVRQDELGRYWVKGDAKIILYISYI